MANFARSFKSPSYLSPRLRPTMPGRTISASSDLSVASSNNSPHSDDYDDLIISGRNTPVLSNVKGSSQKESCERDSTTAPTINIQDGSLSDRHQASDLSCSPGGSRPIAIELPHLKRFSSAPARTPPEPLSARGDLPGGYFPLHEDPNTRVHRPHPFQHRSEAKGARSKPRGLILDTGPGYVERCTTSSARLSVAQTNTPVASYLAPGFHDSPLPMGKYYPSNYENRNGQQGSWRPPTSGSQTADMKSQKPSTVDGAPGAATELDVRRKLQQYQRDMIAQASMAASQLLSSRAVSSSNEGGGPPMQEIKFQTQAHLKPTSPRLLPMGSPGPVTPMSLEFGSEGGYLDVAKQEHRFTRSPLAG